MYKYVGEWHCAMWAYVPIYFQTIHNDGIFAQIRIHLPVFQNFIVSAQPLFSYIVWWAGFVCSQFFLLTNLIMGYESNDNVHGHTDF